MTATQSERIRARRAGRIESARADPTGSPAALRRTLSEGYDGEIAALAGELTGAAVVALGSLGRREVTAYGDIDLLLVHDGREDIGEVADRIWYPLWDAGVALDHSVRTVADAVSLAGDDIAVALGLVDARFIAGDAAVAERLVRSSRDAWRRDGRRNADRLAAAAAERAARFGELAFLIEPDLKAARGGLRDGHALRGLAVAQLGDGLSPALTAAYTRLLDVRTALHTATGRALDRLIAQEQGPLAETLGYDDADDLLRAVSDAGRTIAHAWDVAIRRLPGKPSRGIFTRRTPPRRPLADGVVAHGSEVVLAREADVADTALLLRFAAAAAAADLPMSPYSLDRLLDGAAPMPDPWPRSARDALTTLLGAGRPAVVVIEELDRAGALTRLIPEWALVRSLPQRDPVHRFTVDRHLVETVVNAAAEMRQVARPDLLLLSALLHDIGKGSGRDHSVAGAEIAATVTARMGVATADADLVVAAVRHHLLLPHTATRRDLDDLATIELVAGAIDRSLDLLDILEALATADGLATGPAAWSGWKRGLVHELAARVRATLHGRPVRPAPRIDAARRALTARHEVLVRVEDDPVAGHVVTVAAPDAAGLLSRAAGVLALHHLDVRSATIAAEHGSAVGVFVVDPRFGRAPEAERLQAELRRALAGQIPLGKRLAALDRTYSDPAARPPLPRVLWFDDQATDALIVEIRTPNSIGLLYRLAGALESCAVDIRAARVSTLGPAAVDAFYVALPRAAEPLRARARVEAGLTTAVRGHAVGVTGPAEP